jgi:signal transduction histidine kinase
MAHDLRNVLQIISGNLGILSRRLGEDSSSRIHIDRAMAGVDLGRQLTNRALDRCTSFSSTCLQAERAGLEAILVAAVEPTLAISLEIPTCLQLIAVKVSDLQNALLNLAINARDAMNGNGTLQVTCSNINLENRCWVEIAVRDNGCGMSPETLERIRDPYFTTKGDLGTGLGLSSVRQFVQDAGGTMKVESKPNVGTTVTLRLPAV